MAKIQEGDKVLAVVGSRDFPNEQMVRTWVRTNAPKFDFLVTGGAQGVDKWAEQEWLKGKSAESLRLFPANWKRYKGAAGMIRNLRIISDADFVAVFWHELSPGSLDDIGLVMASGIPANIYIR